MRSFSIVLGVCLALVGWWLLPGPDASGPEPLLPRPAAPTDGLQPESANADSAGRREAAPRPTKVETIEARRKGRSASELEGELEQLMQVEGLPVHRFRDVLQRLVDVGTPEAIGIVVETMRSEAFDSAHRAMTFFELLEDVEDERIYPAAKEVFERNLALGRFEWNHTYGYINLMAASGGAEAEAFVLNLMNDERGQLAYGAVQAVGHLRAHTQSANFLTAIVDHPQRGIARELAMGLAAWREPEVTQRMTELALDAEIDIDTRRTIQNSIARNLERAEVDPFLERYWTASSTEDRSVIAGSLGSIGRESRLPAKDLAKLVEPVLIDAFSDLERSVWASAVVSLGSHREYRTTETLAALRALRERTVDESDLALIDRVLSR